MSQLASGGKAQLFLPAALLVGELFLGSGLGIAAILGAAVCLTIYLTNRREQRGMLTVALVYMVVFVGGVGWIELNWHFAERRTEPVIAACKRFQSDYGYYPKELQQLVSEYLPDIPHAGYTLMSWGLKYDPERPWLGFSVMFHGIASYDLKTNQWRTND